MQNSIVQNLINTSLIDRVIYLNSIDSTNTFVKSQIDMLPHMSVVVASTQTHGYGRQGRSFASPLGGIYMSILLKDNLTDNTALTAIAALSVYDAIQPLVDSTVHIKWVNDVFIEKSKVCGISCERQMDSSGKSRWAMLGIGINVTTDIDSIQQAVSYPVSSVKYYSTQQLDKHKITANIIDNLYDRLSKAVDDSKLYKEYASRMLLGKKLTINMGGVSFAALGIDVNSNGQLIVETMQGQQALSYGEVSIQI